MLRATAKTLALRLQKQQQQALGISEQLHLKVTQQKLRSADCINGSSKSSSGQSSSRNTCPYSVAVAAATKTVALQTKEQITPISMIKKEDYM